MRLAQESLQPSSPRVTKGLVALLTAAVFLPALSSCSSEVKAYEKKAPPSVKANIEQPPKINPPPKKAGDSYTVSGLVHDLHSKVHVHEVKNRKVTVEGYIVKTNLTPCKDDSKAVEENCAPKCAVFTDEKKKQEEGCKTPVPAFYLADKKDEATQIIAVKGWASNFAGIAKCIEVLDKETTVEKQREVKCTDQGQRSLPNPLPAVGAKVRITAVYGPSYRGHGSPDTDPKYGILGPRSESPLIIEVLEPAPELATIPSEDKYPAMVERKKPKEEGKKDDKKKKP